ncbi:hypothetical protein ACFOZY_13565 [Chungangia koreensis]|uniref:Yip1 domain-containing protein n=1 Tax=Chungangia koreensis TaxID=752657 RepID=A0ABV8X7P6_9LACT
MNEKRDENKEDILSVLKDPDLKKVLNFNRFHQLLFATKKYKDLISEKEAFFNFLLSIGVLVLVHIFYNQSRQDFFNSVLTLIPVFIGGMFTILGLSLAGLAIVTATIGEKFITKLVKEKKLYSLIDIIFSFYFAGAIISLTIIILLLTYFIIMTVSYFNIVWFSVVSFINIYFTFFSLIYSVMLLGTCIRLLLVKYAIEKKLGEENKE